LAAAADGNIYI
jgi:hypothetical protein